MRRASVQLLALGAIGANAAPVERRGSHPVERRTSSDACYSVADESFTSHFSVDFTMESSLPAPLVASTYTVAAGVSPYARQFAESNIIASSGSPLKMVVPGSQSTDPISSAQMTTEYDDVLYGSVRTVAKASSVGGAIHGFFMYMDDNQETDIEIRSSDPTSVHFTNQETTAGAGETTASVSAPSDMTTAFHEYRYDWLPDRCDFYIDGVLQTTFTDNVPSKAGFLMWNQWSNGNAWSEGPPLADSILEIKSIEAYFNRTSISTTCNSPSGSATSGTSTSAASTTSSLSTSSSPVSISSALSSSSSSSSQTPSTIASTTKPTVLASSSSSSQVSSSTVRTVSTANPTTLVTSSSSSKTPSSTASSTAPTTLATSSSSSQTPSSTSSTTAPTTLVTSSSSSQTPSSTSSTTAPTTLVTSSGSSQTISATASSTASTTVAPSSSSSQASSSIASTGSSTSSSTPPVKTLINMHVNSHMVVPQNNSNNQNNQ